MDVDRWMLWRISRVEALRWHDVWVLGAGVSAQESWRRVYLDEMRDSQQGWGAAEGE